jgi:hypothetical protein
LRWIVYSRLAIIVDTSRKFVTRTLFSKVKSFLHTHGPKH